ncbi:MAG: glycosyltransferase family 2 protein [Acidobacteriota bacterium]
MIAVCEEYEFAVSVIVVSFNTRELLRECLQSLLAECARLPEGTRAELLVVDNASRDGSADMVARDFAQTAVPVRLIRSEVNLGFGAANNLAMETARGRYLVLLNSDAFFHPGALGRAMQHMEQEPAAGAGGACLIGRDGQMQFSGRMFHTVLRDACVLTGLARIYSKSRLFAALDRTWADLAQTSEVDWITGAFMILRRDALARTGLFDPRFFLYYEEVDLCRRIQQAGFRVMYWPDVVVTHLGGESSRQVPLTFSESAAQVVLWRMRSTLLYYRKHHAWQAWVARWLEDGIYMARRIRNHYSADPRRRERAREAALLSSLLRQAWKETRGGRVSPPRPW